MTGGNLDEMLDEDPYRRGRRSAGHADRRAAGRRPDGYPEDGYADEGYAEDGYVDEDYAGEAYADGDYADGDYADEGQVGASYSGSGHTGAGHDDEGYADDYGDDGHPRDAGAGSRRDRGGRRRDRHSAAGGYPPDDAEDWGGGWDDDGADERRGRALPKLIAVLLVVAALLGVAIFGIGKVIGRVSGGSSTSADYDGSGDGIAVVQVPDGATARQIAVELHDADVTASVSAFVKAASANPKSLGIQPGTYRLRSRMSAEAALAALLDPASSAPFKFVIKEGMTVHQVLDGLHQRLGLPLSDLEAIARNPAQLGLPSYAPTLEGYLFPSTYDLVPGSTPSQLLTSFVARFKKEAASIDLEARATAMGVRPADIVTIASIVEKEVANASEGPKVARVIYNRLHDTTGRFRRLDMDSTTRYAEDEYEGPLTKDQLNKANPYNTRSVAGLPPGAISNPGIWALKSALEPAAGSWLYFVSMPQSRVTRFATTDAEWAEARAQYRAEGGRE
ncbi:endolytic transglycosylase MltG [Frankia sp. AvcI1]|uniref:endolytic transglycosylase MltG n=1 Tax=Frankia sp. AvcI1 TaxID=573496 RepID=UPI0021180F23|nr:endolytic transglycosylase MltG [Frankia sp. AvcI1]